MTKKSEEIRETIMTRASKETKPLVKKIEDIKARIAQLESRALEATERVSGLRGSIAQLRTKALSLLKGGDDPLPSMREAVQAEQDLAALRTLPDLNEEAIEALEQERDETMMALHRVLSKAAGEVRREQNREFTRKLAGLLEDQEAWLEAVRGVSLAGVGPIQQPVVNQSGYFSSNNGLEILECLHGGLGREIERLISKSHPEPNYKLD